MKPLAMALELQEDKELPQHLVTSYAQSMAMVLPELVEALRAMVGLVGATADGYKGLDREVVNRARAAIAKATGVES